ncbi:uncharacterized protein LOC112171736 [Rosa chinensis]|uniref:uncharacterized protein LOC112171736 n=1 Tax=Rosa chinensis TaxID=74649 RepID=UPI000D0879DA|nr:uncharacterized protein LOC112171736 [Rosa chinensis]
MAFRKRSKSRQEQKADEGNGFDEGSSTSDLDSSDNVSERLSDIDDAEISPYLLTKKEALYKTIIWEAMHKDYVEKRSTRKRARKAKEAGPRRKAAKTSTKQSDERHGNLAPEVKKGRSSKINYNAINEEDCRLEEGLESNEKVIGAEHSEEAQDGQGYYDDNYESEHQNQYNEEDESYYANDDGDDNGHNDGWF